MVTRVPRHTEHGIAVSAVLSAVMYNYLSEV